MKKLIPLLAAALLLTGCGGSNSEAQTSQEQTVEQTAEDTTTNAGTDTSSSDTTVEGTEATDEMQYVIDEGITPTMKELSQLNIGNQARLADVFTKAAGGLDITIAYIGGSITQGSSAGSDLCYAKLTTDWFRETFPDIEVNYVNAGIGATGSYIGVHRVDEDVLSKEPDLVFVEFSVNDTTENTQLNIDSYDSMLRKIWKSESKPAIICLTMTMEDGTSFQNYHAEIAQSYNLPVISYKNAILHVIEQGYIQWTDISDDNIHPNVAGHKVLTELITSYLEDAYADYESVDYSESDFSTPYSDDVFADATLITPDTANVESLGIFTKADSAFGNINGYWNARYTGVEGTDDSLVIQVRAQNIGLLYGMLTSNGGTFDVYVDGTKATTLSEDFSGGWGSYVVAKEIIRFETTDTHTVEIRPVAQGEKAQFVISAIAVS